MMFVFKPFWQFLFNYPTSTLNNFVIPWTIIITLYEFKDQVVIF